MFEPQSVSNDTIGKYSGSGDLPANNMGISSLVYKAWGLLAPEENDEMKVWDILVPDGHLFSYMFRRFGTPVSPCDELKQMGEWYLTTPMAGLYLTVYPFMGTGFGYIASKSLKLDLVIWREQDAPIADYWLQFKAWAKKEHAFEAFVTHSFGAYTRLALETENSNSDGRYFFVKNEQFAIAWGEYAKWVADTPWEKDNLADEYEHFMGVFNAFKSSQIDKYQKLYAEVEPFPAPGPSETLNKMIAALSETAVSLLCYTYVRDVCFNAIGFKIDETTHTAELLKPYGDEWAIGYTDPNTFISVYRKGLKGARHP